MRMSKNIPYPRGVILRSFSASKKTLIINMSIYVAVTVALF